MKIFNLVLLLAFFIHLKSQNLHVFSSEKLDEKINKSDKTTVIYLYTDWCMYCKAMENTTFKIKTVIEVLNQDFNFFKLNAEHQENIFYNSQLYQYKSTGKNIGTHQLVTELMKTETQIIYPSLIIIQPKSKTKIIATGYLSEKQIMQLLTENK